MLYGFIFQDQIAMNATDSSGSSWSNIPRCLNTVQTTSMLSSDAGISSMPSSMISNISETEHHTLTNFNSLQHQEIIIRNNFTENISVEQPPMVLAPEHFTTSQQTPEFECLEKVDSSEFHNPDVLEMTETQQEPKV